MDCSPSSSAAPPRRSGRRKLVQSTLFPLKPPEPVEKKDKEDELDEDYSEAKNNKKRKRSKAKATPPIDEDYSEAENNKKRKMSKAKATPPKKGSSKVVPYSLIFSLYSFNLFFFESFTCEIYKLYSSCLIMSWRN